MADSDLSFRCNFRVPSGLDSRQMRAFVSAQLFRIIGQVDAMNPDHLTMFQTIFSVDDGEDVGRFAVKRADYR